MALTADNLVKILLIEAVIRVSCVLADFSLTLTHTNDVHAKFGEITGRGAKCPPSGTSCYGGVARRLTALNDIRAQHENVILLDAGDQFQGSVWFVVYQGQAASHFMNRLGYDAMAIGNHEFDLGVPGLVPFLRNVTFPVLSCNIDASNEPDMQGLFKKSTVLSVGGERIGVIGYTTVESVQISDPGDLIFNDVVTSVEEEAARLTQQGVNKIIAVGHAGFATDKDVARRVHDVDVVVGGHTNTFLFSGTPSSSDLPTGPYPVVVGKASGKGRALVVQDYAHAKYLGFLQIQFDDDGEIISWHGQPILLDDSVEQDPALLEEANEWAVEVNRLYDIPIGHSNVFLDGTRQSCRLQECNLGNLLADAAALRHVRKASNESWTGAAIALLNGGSIRDSIGKGVVTYGDLFNVQPFGNTLDIVTLQGKFILQILQHSVKNYDVINQHGKFLQMSGMRVQYDLSKTGSDRVADVKILCSDCSVPEYSDLDPEQMYKVILPAFLVNGGDGYDMIKEHSDYHHIFGDLDLDILAEYFHARSPVTTGLTGRISFVHDSQELCISAANALSNSVPSPILFLCILLGIYSLVK